MENRIDLAKYFNEKGFKVGAEIGVADGRYSEILCQNIPGLKLFCVDPWYPYEGNWRGKEYQQKAFETACERLESYNADILRKTSIQGSLDIPDNFLDFVFIDGAHDFNNALIDVILWTQKVRKGGIVSGHDYYEARTVHVIPAVDAYCKNNGIKLNVIPRTDKGHQDDLVPCWWFVK